MWPFGRLVGQEKSNDKDKCMQLITDQVNEGMNRNRVCRPDLWSAKNVFCFPSCDVKKIYRYPYFIYLKVFHSYKKNLKGL